MSTPLMARVTAPPRPCQKDIWCSFSLTRSGSMASSPISHGRSRRRAPSTRARLVEALPTPDSPWSVSTCTRWAVFPGRGLLPPALRDPAPQGPGTSTIRIPSLTRQTLRRWCAGRASGPCWPPPAPASSHSTRWRPCSAVSARASPPANSPPRAGPQGRGGGAGGTSTSRQPPAGLEVLQRRRRRPPRSRRSGPDQAERPGAAVELQARPPRGLHAVGRVQEGEGGPPEVQQQQRSVVYLHLDARAA